MEEEIALPFLRAVGYRPVICIVERRGKVYNMLADKRTHRKIIARKQLEHMSLHDLILWLHKQHPIARLLFPQPDVYQEE